MAEPSRRHHAPRHVPAAGTGWRYRAGVENFCAGAIDGMLLHCPQLGIYSPYGFLYCIFQSCRCAFLNPMKILRLWHAAVVTEYRKKLRAIALRDDIDLRVLVPVSWIEGGKRTFFVANNDIDLKYAISTGRVLRRNNIQRHFYLTRLFGLMLSFKPDIIDMEEEPHAYVALQVTLYKKLLSPKSKIIFHSADSISRHTREFAGIYRSVLAGANAAIVRNQQTRQKLQQNGFTKPIFITGNGIDLSHFTPAPVPHLRNELGIADKIVIGFVGKLKKGKGIWTLLEAFAQLPPSTHLLMVGDGNERQAFADKVTELKIAHRVILTGTIEHDKVLDYYRAMDVCVLPSITQGGWKEFFGRTLIEAMACGIPVIGSSSGSIPDTIGNAGLIFREKEAGDLLDKMRILTGNQEVREDLIRKGRQRAREFSWENVAQVHWQAYDCVMGTAQDPHASAPGA
ncbi:MAG: glycosyltransferase [Chitinivibrionales bacterium]|nr:glycosyltransferase [Chitinivibrionales bacterium]